MARRLKFVNGNKLSAIGKQLTLIFCGLLVNWSDFGLLVNRQILQEISIVQTDTLPDFVYIWPSEFVEFNFIRVMSIVFEKSQELWMLSSSQKFTISYDSIKP